MNNLNIGAGTAVILNLSTTAATTTGSLSGALGTPSSGTNTATINNGGQLFTVNQTTAGTYAGVIAGAGGFTLGSLSTGTLNLTGANPYSGDTTVSGGTLQLPAGGSISGETVIVGNMSGDNGALSVTGGSVVSNAEATLATIPVPAGRRRSAAERGLATNSTWAFSGPGFLT